MKSFRAVLLGVAFARAALGQVSTRPAIADSERQELAVDAVNALVLRGSSAAALRERPPHWRGWAFGRLGRAQAALSDGFGSTAVTLITATGGVAASYGPILAMVRASDTERFSFEDSSSPGIQDYAFLGGVRSRGNRLFVTGAFGLAQSTDPGVFNAPKPVVAAFDFSAHAAYRIAGTALSISGLLGPRSTRYVAISLGLELGWFGL